VRNRLVRLGAELDDGDMAKALGSLDMVTADLQMSVMKTRMQPVKKVFGRFPRLVRDLSRQLHKEVNLELRGEDTDLDKNLVEALADPLIHLVRNAIDHGIEEPEVRERNDKPREGHVLLSAEQEGDHILLIIEDDGAGMDPDKLRALAVKRGMLDQEAAARLSDHECYNLIFAAGFSTKEQISDVSGRGVGMDVVKQKIVEMRGELDINSQPEKGTVFTIKLQQSIAILETLLLRTDNMNCLIPITDIEGCSQRSYHEVSSRIKHGTIGYEERLIPFVSLRELFSLNGDRPEMTKMIILKKNENRFAIFADQIIGQHQAVLKPMGDLVKDHREISAASILGNGEVAYLLDMNTLA